MGNDSQDSKKTGGNGNVWLDYQTKRKREAAYDGNPWYAYQKERAGRGKPQDEPALKKICGDSKDSEGTASLSGDGAGREETLPLYSEACHKNSNAVDEKVDLSEVDPCAKPEGLDLKASPDVAHFGPTNCGDADSGPKMGGSYQGAIPAKYARKTDSDTTSLFVEEDYQDPSTEIPKGSSAQKSKPGTAAAPKSLPKALPKALPKTLPKTSPEQTPKPRKAGKTRGAQAVRAREHENVTDFQTAVISEGGARLRRIEALVTPLRNGLQDFAGVLQHNSETLFRNARDQCVEGDLTQAPLADGHQEKQLAQVSGEWMGSFNRIQAMVGEVNGFLATVKALGDEILVEPTVKRAESKDELDE